MRRFASFIVRCVAAILLMTAASSAKDLEALSRLLLPAYVAQNFSMLCAVDNPRFQAETSGPRGPAPAYGQHVKEEIIASLTPDEARRVVVRAADAAKTLAIRELKELSSGETIEPALIRAWCERTAKEFVTNTIAAHEMNHATFEQQITRAKK